MSDLRFDARVKRAMACGEGYGFDVQVLAPGSGVAIPPMTARRKIEFGLSFALARMLGENALETAHSRMYPYKQMLDQANAILPDLIHAHDWDTLPIAAAIKTKLNIPIIYDTHEYAQGMHYERRMWRYLVSPSIARLERANLSIADSVVTVSEGIAQQLQIDHGLETKPSVVRNLPDYQDVSNLSGVQDDMPVNAQSRQVIMHYHGILAEGRGIELLVKTLAHLPAHYHLRLIGPERQKDFTKALRALAITLGAGERLSILPPVPPEKLVEAAASADIGFCILENNNPHYSFALPNKVFEYIMAGLYVITSDSPDMARVVLSDNAGAVTPTTDPEKLAQEIRSISPKQLFETRLRNLKSAKTLCWENEQVVLGKIYQRFF